MIPTGELVAHLVTVCSLIVGPAGVSGSQAEVEHLSLVPESCLLVDASEWGCNRPFLNTSAPNKSASPVTVPSTANYPEPYVFRTTPMWPLDSAEVAPLGGYAAANVGVPSCVLVELTKWGDEIKQQVQNARSSASPLGNSRALTGAPPAPERHVSLQASTVAIREARTFGYDFAELSARDIYGRPAAAVDPATPYLSDYDAVYDRELLRQPASQREAAARTIADWLDAPVVSRPILAAGQAAADLRQSAHRWAIRTGLVQRYASLVGPWRTAETSSAKPLYLSGYDAEYDQVMSRNVGMSTPDLGGQRSLDSMTDAARGLLLKAAAVLDQTGLALQGASQRLSVLAVGESSADVDTASRDEYRSR
ncbi:MAG: hypothetical protein WDZ59_09400 [Pirellulales bacterium]